MNIANKEANIFLPRWFVNSLDCNSTRQYMNIIAHYGRWANTLSRYFSSEFWFKFKKI